MRKVFAGCTLVFLAACGGSSGAGTSPSYDPLFGPPSNTRADPNSVLGLWAASASANGVQLDMRFRIDSNSMTIANRCHFSDGSAVTVGTDVAIRVSDAEITVLETKSDQAGTNDDRCNVNASAGPLEYTLSGGQLTLTSLNAPDELHLVKVSD
jgi:hypothetical protein